MFPKRRSKNYDSPAEGELEGNYTVVSDSLSANGDNNEVCDVQSDVQQMNLSSSSCTELVTVESRPNRSRQSLPGDIRTSKEKRVSLKKRLSFRLFDSKGKKKTPNETNETDVPKHSSRKPDNEDRPEGVKDVLDANKGNETVVCKRDSSLLEEILAETALLSFKVTEQKSAH